MRRASAVFIVCWGAVACYVGPNVARFAPATGPRGIAVDLRLDSAQVQGELLEVQDSALLVLRADRVVLVRLAAIHVGNFAQRGTLVVNGGFVIGSKEAAKARLLSRYPAGLTPAIKTRLLAAYGQTEPDRAP